VDDPYILAILIALAQEQRNQIKKYGGRPEKPEGSKSENSEGKKSPKTVGNGTETADGNGSPKFEEDELKNTEEAAGRKSDVTVLSSQFGASVMPSLPSSSDTRENVPKEESSSFKVLLSFRAWSGCVSLNHKISSS
jgi:hypothetical protein